MQRKHCKTMKRLTTIFVSFLLLLTSSVGLIACEEPEKDAVNIKYYSEASQIPPLILGGAESIGLVPEPAATALEKNASNQGKTLYRLDLQELYDSRTKAYPQAVLMVKKSVLGSHQDLYALLKSKISDSVSWIKQNTQSAVLAISNHGSTTLKAPALTEKAIDGCKIYWQDATDAKASVKQYVNDIISIDSSKAKVIGDDFFYTQSNLTNTKQQYSFVMPDGAPALAVSKLMHDNDSLNTGKQINYSVLSALEVRSKLIAGSADFVLCPVNLASQYYLECDALDHYVMVSVITHGNFYILSTEQISLDDLAGKQIAVPMMGAVPDWTFKMVLGKHNLNFNTVE